MFTRILIRQWVRGALVTLVALSVTNLAFPETSFQQSAQTAQASQNAQLQTATTTLQPTAEGAISRA